MVASHTDTDAEVLIVPMHATQSLTDPPSLDEKESLYSSVLAISPYEERSKKWGEGIGHLSS